MLPVGIRWVLIKYHIKPLNMKKSEGFLEDLYEYDLILYP